MKQHFSLRQFFQSCGYAVRGIRYALETEQSFRIQAVGALMVFILMVVLPLAPWEMVTLLLTMMIVLVLELVNTIFERLVDVVKPRFATYVQEVKDLMSGAVLIASLFALAIGSAVLLPYLFSLFA